MGPHSTAKVPENSLHRKLCSKKRLLAAWKVVERNGRQSSSDETRREVEEFGKNAEHRLSRILLQLRAGSYGFAPARGIPVEKKGKKKKRPIVRAPVESRIVQRAILDVIQTIPAIKKILRARFNFGGIRDGGVPEAVIRAFRTATTHPHFVRTDIKGFFDNVPREKAIKQIIDAISHDEVFAKLFTAAVTVELDNLASLSAADRKLFPLEELGVAQGSALSPLICNVYLHQFDKALNDKRRRVVCIRYIDDFIILAPDLARAHATLKSARKMLEELGLDAYDPRVDKGKAEEGSISGGCHFLGCEIFPKQINPDRDSRSRLEQKIRVLFRDGLKLARLPRAAIARGMTFSDVMQKASNIVRGWGNTYYFCNDDRVFAQLDNAIDELVDSFRQQYGARARGLTVRDRRQLLGVRLLTDRKKKPDALSTRPASKGKPGTLPAVSLPRTSPGAAQPCDSTSA